MTFMVLLDANVLAPQYMNDILLSIASQETYSPQWSDEIMTELARTLENFNLPPLAAKRRIEQMNLAFPDAVITDYQHLTSGLMAVDSKDRHVLAAAIIGKVGALVTFNLKDFPENIYETYGIELLHPDDFLENEISLSPASVSDRIALMLCRWEDPKFTALGFVNEFSEFLPLFCNQIRKLSSEIEFKISLHLK